MRIALISDIHANLFAFDAVLSDIRTQDVDQVICLGDVAAIGPQPRECVLRLQETGFPCVMGNHDSFYPDENRDDRMVENIDWCADQLSADDLAFLRSFPPHLEVPLADTETLLCFHGSPLSNMHVIVAQTPPATVDEYLGPHRAAYMVGGHTHTQLLRKHRGETLFNPGSVGMPFKENPFQGGPVILPWAEYAILSYRPPEINIEFKRIPYDVTGFQQLLREIDMPQSESLLQDWKFNTK